MNLPLSKRLELLERLGKYVRGSNNEEWEQIKEKVTLSNSWFIPEFVNHATQTIGEQFLIRKNIEQWIQPYSLAENTPNPQKIGLVMAGNIPAVGFHDFLCGFLSGHQLKLKMSSKDKVLIPHFIQKLKEWAPELKGHIESAEMLKGCDAYIATGSNNSARYFHQYFKKYPHIIRRNRTAVAVLNGLESEEDLDLLADDILMYFGRGCRNVTKIYVPENYDFIPLLDALKKYEYFADFHHYKNNFDYQLSLLLLNKVYYMGHEAILLRQHESLFSAVGVLHYEYYKNKEEVTRSLMENDDLQCIVGKEFVPFGKAQSPDLKDYADGKDTLAFLTGL